MRKHFLLLFLMALLPLAGWAAGSVDITGYQITLSSAEATYTAGEINFPNITLTKNGANPIDAASVNVVWKNSAGTQVQKATVVGEYTVTVTAKEGFSTGTLAVNKKTFTVKKRDLIVKVSDLGAADASAKHKTYGFKVADFASESNTDWGIWAVSTVDGEGFQETSGQPTLNVLVNWGTDVNAGEHTFTLSADALANYNVVFKPSDTGKWWIDKKDLAVTANPFALTYGDEFKGDEHVTYDGFIDGEDQKVLGGKLDFTTNYTKGSGITTATNTYSYQPTGLTSNNYNISYNNGVITVNAKDITTKEVTIADFDAVTYNKKDQKPEAIKEGTFTKDQFTHTLTYDADESKTDYVLTYYTTATKNNKGQITGVSSAVTSLVDAKTYYVKIEGKNNFTGTAYKEFTINKKQLGVRTKTSNKVYDATDKYSTVTGEQSDATNLIFSGLITESGTSGQPGYIAADTYPDILANSNNKIKLILKKDGAVVTKAINAGDYDIVVDQTNASNLFTNYEPVYANGGQLKIAKRKLEIKPKDKSKKFGETDNFVAGVVATKDDVTVVSTTSTDDELVNNTADNIHHVITAYPLLKRAEGENKATYDINLVEDDTHKLVIKASSADNAEDVTNNYEVTFGKGKFTINAGQISIFADEKTFTYGQKTVAQAQECLTATIVGMTEAEKTQVQAAVNAALSIEIDENLKLADNDLLPANTTGYSIKIGDLTTAIPEEILANYEGEINKFADEAKFIVNKKALTKVTAKQQALQLGQKLSDLVKDVTTIEIEGLAEGDDAADVIKEMKLQFASYVTKDGDGKLITPTSSNANEYKDGTYFKAILFDDASPMKNYEYPAAADKKVAGDLVITAANQALTLDATLATNTATLTANVGKRLNVTIKGRTLQANKWNALSLPFSISVRDLSKVLGYAIIDRFQQSGDKLSFKIYIGEIPAYTPFLVKVDENVDMQDKVFEKVVVETPKTVTEENDTWKFINTIEFDNVEGLVYNIKPNVSENQVTLGRHSNGADLPGFYAYFTTQDGNPAQDARIYIEEPDGSTTAISAIDADGVAVKAEGWYTINGMKLEGMPTEKGIYIQNGKKVVVK